jgi:hypothetical protein
MKACPNCHSKYPDDANFCPQETCATPEGPRRLNPVPAAPAEAAPRFQLTSKLGGGRSGEVWVARDTQTNEDVAYKLVVPAVLPTAATFERAQRELKQLQRAQNVHLAKIVDFGRSADGRLFVATEIVGGQPLNELVGATGPLPVDRAKKIIAQIGEALLEGQKVGVVHHDLSSKNVFIGSNDEVKVINFVTPWPISESVFGVPEYLSPEQAEGKLVDQRSNTYSLGALLQLMLTGQPPVSGANEAAVIDQILHGEATPPSRLRQGLTPEIDRVVLKAMDKNPSRRPLTMRQFLSEVAGIVGMPGVAVAAPASAGAPKGAAFAKTMMFAGGAPEVQNLVNQAAAARDAANGTAPPAVAPVVPVPTPAPVAAAASTTGRTHGAAVAATMVALPSAGGAIPGAAPIPGSGPAAAPVMQAAPAPSGGGGGGAAGGGGGGAGGSGGGGGGGAGFRETLWFKKGDVEQMVAEAKAKAAAAAAKGKGGAAAATPEEPPIEDAKPLEDRYKDDGSLTVEDRKKFSLRSGSTQTAMPTVGGVVPGDRMSDAELVNEIGGGKKIAIIGVAVAVIAIIIAVVVMSMGGKKEGHSSEAPPAAAAPAAAAAVPPPAAAPAAAAAAAAPAAPAPADAAKAPEAAPPAAAKAEAPAKAQAAPAPAHKHAAKAPAAKKKSSSSSKKKR